MKITGIEIRNFRSIGEEGVALRPWGKCNILIGQNNSGKSNVIRAVKKIAQIHGKDNSGKLTELDLHNRDQSSAFRYQLEFLVEDGDPKSAADIANALGSTRISFDISVRPPSSITFDRWSGMDVKDFNVANNLLSAIANEHWTRRVSENDMTKKMKELAGRAFESFSTHIPKIHTIPEFRQIRKGDTYSLDGQDLVKLLGRFQNPPIGQDELKDRFAQIEAFVQDLLHMPKASLDVTREDELLIDNNGLRLPLSSYGTGTHELVIMLTAVLSNQGDLYCIEEPEIHMHPRLQKEFVHFLTTSTTNTYLISSHSHALINAIDWLDDVQVFHLQASSGSTIGHALVGDRAALRALNDLGVRPSDVLQSNCTIWVEGPSTPWRICMTGFRTW